MPKLADTLVEGTVAHWRKQVGDLVAAGEVLCDVETDKVSTELQVPVGGTLLVLLAREGVPVPVESVIARIGTSAGAPAITPAQPATAVDAPPPRATSVAARMLAAHGLRAEDVPPARGARRISKQDVLRTVAAAHPAPATTASPVTLEPEPLGARSNGPAPFVLQPASSMRRAIADHMAQARATIPHGQTVIDVDMTDLAAWRDLEKSAFQQREGASLTYTVLFAAAFARALAATALAGASGAVHLGVAVALDGGLIAPVLRDAQRLALGALARGLSQLVDRARGGSLGLEDTRGALATISNVGSFGNLMAFPIVPVGQAGILAAGAVRPTPVLGADGGIRAGRRCLVSLVYDRRVLTELAADHLLGAVATELGTLHS